MTTITPEEIKLIANYVAEISGISLDEKKAYLMESRLASVVKEFGCRSYIDLYHRARSDRTKSIEKRIVDTITTNETFFFRDTDPFEVLQHKILPELIEKKRPRIEGLYETPIHIWSAGCSAGQESYSIAIAFKELLGGRTGFSARILGSDISDAVISQARKGLYGTFEVERGLTDAIRERYFVPAGVRSWQVNDEIRAMVRFERQNLMKPFTGMGKFDIVFCRNVAIYFTHEERVKLFDRIADVLERDGYLIIGATESLTDISSRFELHKYQRCSYYKVRGDEPYWFL